MHLICMLLGKICAKCVSVNHMSIDYKTVVSSTPSQPQMSNLDSPNLPDSICFNGIHESISFLLHEIC